MKKYPAYKESGVEWIGEIPVHWEIGRIKYFNEIIMGQSPSSEDYTENPNSLPFLQGNAEFGNYHPTPSIYCDTANKKTLKDDILISVRAPVGAINVSDREYGIGRGLAAVRSIERNRFNYYYLSKSKNYLDSLSTGSTFTAITVEDLRNLPYPKISNTELSQIATFLDNKTSQIDDLIAKKQKLIELLKEERTTLINQTITKGLDPTVPMKESAIEWLGEIPEHWEVSKIKYCTEINNDVLGDDTPDDFEFKYVDIGIVTFGKLNGLPEKLLFKNAPSRARRILHEGDTIISTVRTYLKAILFIDNSLNEFVGSTGFAVITPTRRFIPKYLFYIMTSQKIIEQICAISVGVSYPATNASDIGNISIWLPPIKEQDKIVNFIEERMNYLTNIEERSMKEIELISEYKTSLINEVVTGKIQVSDAD